MIIALDETLNVYDEIEDSELENRRFGFPVQY